MSLFADYKAEREGKLVIETDKAFAIYSIVKDSCYIEDIYVSPEFRKAGVAKQMADFISDIAKQKNCKYLFGSVAPSGKGSQESLKILLAYGMRLHSSMSDMVFFVKDL